MGKTRKKQNGRLRGNMIGGTKGKRENEREPQRGPDQEGYSKSIQGQTQRQALRGVERERGRLRVCEGVNNPLPQRIYRAPDRGQSE